MSQDFVAIPGNCIRGYQRHRYASDIMCWRCGKPKPASQDLYCHQCGYRHIIHESPAEGYYCPHCGCSDSDE